MEKWEKCTQLWKESIKNGKITHEIDFFVYALHSFLLEQENLKFSQDSDFITFELASDPPQTIILPCRNSSVHDEDKILYELTYKYSAKKISPQKLSLKVFPIENQLSFHFLLHELNSCWSLELFPQDYFPQSASFSPLSIEKNLPCLLESFQIMQLFQFFHQNVSSHFPWNPSKDAPSTSTSSPIKPSSFLPDPPQIPPFRPQTIDPLRIPNRINPFSIGSSDRLPPPFLPSMDPSWNPDSQGMLLGPHHPIFHPSPSSPHHPHHPHHPLHLHHPHPHHSNRQPPLGARFDPVLPNSLSADPDNDELSPPAHNAFD
eukprot:Sdes_comp20739_c0_seq1m16595